MSKFLNILPYSTPPVSFGKFCMLFQGFRRLSSSMPKESFPSVSPIRKESSFGRPGLPTVSGRSTVMIGAGQYRSSAYHSI